MDVFKTPPRRLVPNDSHWEAVAKTDCTIAVCAAPGKGGHVARRIGPDGITLTQRGTGSNTRFINNIAMENEDYADSLLVTEVFTPAGNWSSYPSHRHDEDDFPRMTYLEETYYHRINPGSGWGIQRVYTNGIEASMRRWRSPTPVVWCWFPRAITPVARFMVTRCIISMSWPDPCANGGLAFDPDHAWVAERDAAPTPVR